MQQTCARLVVALRSRKDGINYTQIAKICIHYDSKKAISQTQIMFTKNLESKSLLNDNQAIIWLFQQVVKFESFIAIRYEVDIAALSTLPST